MGKRFISIGSHFFSSNLRMRISGLCLAVLFCLSVVRSRAQDTTWYGAVDDNSHRHINSITAKTDSGWRMTSYYASGKTSSTGLFADDSCTVAKGDRVYYSTSGKVSRRVHFDNGEASGDDTYYYENGKVLATGVNRNGAPDGQWQAWYRSGRLAAKVLFAGGHQTAANFYDEDGGARRDVNTFFQESTYPGGKSALYQYLDKNIQYPASAFVYNVQGVVVLQFRVTRDGNTVDLGIIQNVDPALDKEAYRVVSGMLPWRPARIGGIPVDTFQRLPIQFKQ
jgi:TonB family protein